jgi:hypothetical protein
VKPDALQVSRRGADGITVPYGRIFDGVRKNNGFKEVRGRPDLAAQISEGGESRALRDLLVRIAGENVYVSIGCDLGDHPEPESPAGQRQVAGGYIQVAAINYSDTTTDQYDEFCKSVPSELRKRANSFHWRSELVGTWVKFCFPTEATVTSPSMSIWFFAAARTKAKALVSRETLIGAISDVLHMPEVASTLRSSTDEE